MSKPARIAVACMAVGALSVVAFLPSPIYDPAAWMVWAAELPHLDLGLAAGPSWKPLPVIVTAPATLVSWEFAFVFWLWIVRSCTVATSVMLWRLAADRAGPLAGTVAALAPLAIGDWVHLSLGGGAEPVLMALALGAIEAHLSARRRLALALGVTAGLLRPEVWLFLVAYGAWLLTIDARRYWRPLALGCVVELVGWFAIPAALGSDPMQASRYARAYGDDPGRFLRYLGRTFESMPWGIWVLAALGVLLALRSRDRLLGVLAGAAGAWIAAVGALSIFGYSGIGRYSLPALVVLCVHSGTGAAGVIAAAGRRNILRAAAAGVVVVLLSAAAITAASTARERLDRVRLVDRLTAEAHEAIRAAGGMDRVAAEYGTIGTNWTYATTLAWRERGPLGRITRVPEAPTVLLVLDGARAKDQPMPPIGTTGRRTLLREGRWRFVEYYAGASARPGK